jgi:hypothetical protein
LLFATGNNLAHPAPILKAFAAYELPPQICAEFGFRQITRADRRNILGLNAVRRLGLDSQKIIESLAEDEFSHAYHEGTHPPWSVLRTGSDRLAS